MKKLLVLFLGLALVGCAMPSEEVMEEETPAVEVEMMEETSVPTEEVMTEEVATPEEEVMTEEVAE